MSALDEVNRLLGGLELGKMPEDRRRYNGMRMQEVHMSTSGHVWTCVAWKGMKSHIAGYLRSSPFRALLHELRV